jgi:hypothetical protein
MASSSESWCKVSPTAGASDQESGSFKIICETNTSYDARTCNVTIKAEELVETITVSQETNLGIIISPTAFNISNESQTIEAKVNANVKFEVIVPDDANGWINVASIVETKGLSSSKVLLSIAENSTYEKRAAVITIKQLSGTLSGIIRVNQDGRNISDLSPYILLTFSTSTVPSIQIIPESAKWTIYWGKGEFSYSPSEASYTYKEEGSHDVILSGSEITGFSTSIKGLELIDLSNFE